MRHRHLAAAICSVITFLPAAAPAADAPLKVVASFSIIGDLARQVGGDRIALQTLIGPGADAHAHAPQPADAIALAKADVVLVNGLHLEGALDRLITTSGTSAKIATLSDGVTTLEDPDGGHSHAHSHGGEDHDHGEGHDSDGDPADHDDPHAWQSPRNVMIYMDNIADAFCEADAAGCPAYRANAAAYNRQLEALDADIRQSLATVPVDRRTVVVAHDAFRYFGAAYGVTFLAPQGLSTESEASAADVASLVREIRAGHARAIFAESTSDPRLIERIADEAGLKVAGHLYSDALSGPEGEAPTYLALMRHNAAAIASALAD